MPPYPPSCFIGVHVINCWEVPLNFVLYSVLLVFFFCDHDIVYQWEGILPYWSVTGIGLSIIILLKNRSWHPGNPVALSKHTAKDDLSAIGKGKWNADLSSFANLNVQDIHSGFLNRLYTSRDYEASLVNLMKERYEVTTIFLFCPIAVYELLVAPK